MAINTETGAEFVSAMQIIFGKTAEQTKEFVEKSVTGANTALKTEILKEIDLKAGDITALQNAMDTFYTAVDKADIEGEDGVINLGGTFTSIFAKVGLNKAQIDTLTTTVTNLETSLNSKIDAIKKAGEDLAIVVTNIKTSVAGYLERLTAIELVGKNNKDFITGAMEQMATSGATIATATATTYGL